MLSERFWIYILYLNKLISTNNWRNKKKSYNKQSTNDLFPIFSKTRDNLQFHIIISNLISSELNADKVQIVQCKNVVYDGEKATKPHWQLVFLTSICE